MNLVLLVLDFRGLGGTPVSVDLVLQDVVVEPDGAAEV